MASIELTELLTSTVELQSGLELDLLLRAGSLGVRLLSSVQAVDIRLVVLGMVESHNLEREFIEPIFSFFT